MSALFLAPQPFTINAASQQANAPASNLAVDPPGMVWRSTDLNAPYLLIQTAGLPMDTIALVGSNLRANDQVHVQGGSSANMSNVIFDRTLPAWGGVVPKAGAVTLLPLEMAATPAFIRLDFSSAGNPAGYVEASRLILGTRINTPGVDVGAERSYQDGSTIEEALGSSIIDPQRTRDTWKIGVSMVGQDAFWGTWDPFLRRVGNKYPFLFSPSDDPAYLQNQACFGRITSQAKSKWDSWGLCSLDINILQV